MPLTQDPGVIRPSQLYATALASQLKGLISSIKDFDREIEETANTLADYPIFKALPGAGQHLAPRLMVAFGEQRDRFSNANAMQRYVGIAPVTQRSGKKKVVYWRYQCSTFLRQTLSNGLLTASVNQRGPRLIIGSSGLKAAHTRRP
jgi:hypothetical protein